MEPEPLEPPEGAADDMDIELTDFKAVETKRQLQVETLLSLLRQVLPLPLYWLAFEELREPLLRGIDLVAANGSQDRLARALLQEPAWLEAARANPSFDRRFEQRLDSVCLCGAARSKHAGRAAFRDPDYELLDPREDLLAYKIVHFCGHPDGRDKWDDVMAVLHMQLPGARARVWTSDGPQAGRVVQVVPPSDGLHAAQKYNTNHAFVAAVQFCGAPRRVKAALLAYQRDRGFLVSGFGGANKLCYEVGREHVEPRAGARVGGAGCTAGIHFFVDIASAFGYGQPRGSRRDLQAFVVTRRISRQRGMVLLAAEPPLDKAVPLPPDLDACHAEYMAKRAQADQSLCGKHEALPSTDAWLLSLVK